MYLYQSTKARSYFFWSLVTSLGNLQNPVTENNPFPPNKSHLVNTNFQTNPLRSVCLLGCFDATDRCLQHTPLAALGG